MTDFARFWAVDLHTHTPASRDVNVDVYGGSTPEDFVEAAIEAGLDAVAVTDHNTSAWCDKVADAAKGTGLIVLPGVEISTTEGHLLAIWEDGTPSTKIDELLVQLGIGGDDQGKLDIAAEVGFSDAATKVVAAGGLAIAAHVDRPRGLLKLEVAAHVKRTLANDDLCAVEVVESETVDHVRSKVADVRQLACVRGSDTTLPGKPAHVLAGLGSRRTWIKASRPDLIGLRHALQDPDLRVSLDQPTSSDLHPAINSVTFTGGFLDGVEVTLSPDLNCLLGGTGAGKSLVLEAMRFALNQQVSESAFPNIYAEVQSRLVGACGPDGVVRVVVSVDGGRFAIDRIIGSGMDGVVTVYKDIDGDWAQVELDPQELIELQAFSQGEVLEFTRQPVGRMALVDSGLDLNSFATAEDQALAALEANGGALLAQRAVVSRLRAETSGEDELADRVRQLSELFDTDTVKQQESWTQEATLLSELARQLPDPESIELEALETEAQGVVDGNSDLFERIANANASLEKEIEAHTSAIRVATETTKESIESATVEWRVRFSKFKEDLDAELKKVDDGKSLVMLRTQLEKLQADLASLRGMKSQLKDVEVPKLENLEAAREELLDSLLEVRKARRQARRERVDALNAKTAGMVKLDVPSAADTSQFRSHLESLKVGSRVKEEVLDAIAESVHPFSFGRALLAGEFDTITKASEAIDASSVARLIANIEDRNLWSEVLVAQAVSMPDQLNVKFKKPDDGTYVSIESLAHGQRCTAILVVLLADGDAPIVVDQPEDALHAPWIEEYLVDRLRSLRGDRQYIFATRSPGLVVGADAEQIVTMRATAGRGELEAAGSLERHDLNMLALHHLEGGAVPFRRRSAKLDASVRSS